jgi:hypothetical protein
MTMRREPIAAQETRTQDGVFQLSLTEIAFIMAFLVMVLLGTAIVHVEREKADALAQSEELEQAATVLAAAGKARAELAAALSGRGAVDPAQVVSELVAREKIARERDALRAKVDRLEHAVSTLVEAKAPGAAAKSAVAFKTAVEARLQSELGRSIVQGQEEKIAAELVSAARLMAGSEGRASIETFTRENRDLRGQVAFLKTRLEGKGGRDYPPCWADESSGRIQYLVAIDMTNEGLIVTPAWPEVRNIDARALPGLDTLTAAEAALKLHEFKSAVQAIDEHSRRKNCRHYVIMRNHVSELAVFNTYRFAIEHAFYKLEPRP